MDISLMKAIPWVGTFVGSWLGIFVGSWLGLLVGLWDLLLGEAEGTESTAGALVAGSQPQAGCVVVGTSIIGIAFKWNYDYYYV